MFPDRARLRHAWRFGSPFRTSRQPVHLDRAWRDRRATRRAGIGRMRGVLCRAGRR